MNSIFEYIYYILTLAYIAFFGLPEVRGEEEPKTEPTLEERPTLQRDNREKQVRAIRKWLGANLYHKAGYLGQNVSIAVIDSGIAKHVHRKCTIKSKFLHDGDHGTHVSGIIEGIAPKCTLYDFQVFGSMNFDRAFGQAIEGAIANNVDLINLSIGFDSYYGDKSLVGEKYKVNGMYLTIDECYDLLAKHGIICVVAAGNQDSASEELIQQKVNFYTQDPLGLPFDTSKLIVPEESKRGNKIIAVTSCKLKLAPNPTDMPVAVSFSSYNTLNRSVACMAPGENIWSYGISNDYITMSGTSMATPQVVGCLALILSYLKAKYPALKKEQRADIAHTFLLDACTDRDLNTMRDMLTLPIDLHVQKAYSKYYKTVVYKDVMRNPKYCEFVTDLEFESAQGDELDAVFQIFIDRVRNKFTMLSLGYGMVRMRSFPPPSVDAIPPKAHFVVA